MCARYRNIRDVRQLKLTFHIPDSAALPNTRARWNAAPTADMPIIHLDEGGARMIDICRWGLIPHWAKEAKIGYSTFNARSEGIEGKPSFREAFKKRRALVPMDGFYEWKKLGGDAKQPYAIDLADHSIMAVAGLWETWRSPADETVRSFTVITTGANALVAPIHDRMPVILPEAAWPAWLGEQAATREELLGLLRPYPADGMIAWPIDKRVGNTRNDDAKLIEPIELRA